MTVLVTGATGFIGSNLVRALLTRGERVRVLHRPTSNPAALRGLAIESVTGDILDAPSVIRAVEGCDVVYHVAARADYWRASPQSLHCTNVDGTRIVMQACLDARVPRVVHTSSVSAIGLPPRGTLGTEHIPFDAVSARFPYALTKHVAEAEVQKFVARGLPVVIINPVVVVGHGDYTMAVGHFVQEFARGHLPAVPPGGIAVADVDAITQGAIAAAARGRIGERYIMGGENLTYQQIAETLALVLERPAPRWVIPPVLLSPLSRILDFINVLRREPLFMSGEQIRLSGDCHFFDSAKAVRELNYPLLPFRAAVEKACAWYRQNGYL